MSNNKNHTPRKRMLPLRIWGAVMGIAVLTVILLSNLPLSVTKKYRTAHEVLYANYKTRLDNLRKMHPRKSDEYRVVVFGSSLLEHGVFQDQYFNDLFKAAGKAIQVNRIFYAGAFYEMLEDEDLISFLQELKPDLLAIEDQVFLFEPKKGLMKSETPLTTLHKNYVFNLNVLKHKILPGVFAEPGFAGSTDSTLSFDIPHPRADVIISHEDSTNYELTRRLIRKMGETKRFNEALTNLEKNGTALVILQVPRPHAVEKSFMSVRQLEEKEKLISQYQESVNIAYWSFDQPMPFKYYWDIRHLNQYGQAVYSDWLFDKIKNYEVPFENR